MAKYDSTGAEYVNILSDSRSGAPYAQTAIDAHTTSATGTGDIAVAGYRELAIDINLSAFTGTSIAFFVDRKDANGNYYPIASPAALTATGSVNLDLGVGASTNKAFGSTIRVRWTCTAVTVATVAISVIGK